MDDYPEIEDSLWEISPWVKVELVPAVINEVFDEPRNRGPVRLAEASA
jgi:hypothetical protein